MNDEQILLDGNSPELYAPGLLCAHSSDDSGLGDVGISVGLDGESMLFAGEIPDCEDWAMVIYPMEGERSVLLREVDPEGARELIEAVAMAIRRLAK